jgi:hypothetical protein
MFFFLALCFIKSTHSEMMTKFPMTVWRQTSYAVFACLCRTKSPEEYWLCVAAWRPLGGGYEMLRSFIHVAPLSPDIQYRVQNDSLSLHALPFPLFKNSASLTYVLLPSCLCGNTIIKNVVQILYVFPDSIHNRFATWSITDSPHVSLSSRKASQHPICVSRERDINSSTPGTHWLSIIIRLWGLLQN